MSFSLSYSSNIVCIAPRFDAILSEKSGRGFPRFYFRGMKASAEERGVALHRSLTGESTAGARSPDIHNRAQWHH